MKEFLKILTLVKGYKKYAFLNVFFNVLAMIFSIFSIVMLIPIMKILFNQEGEIQELLNNPPPLEFSDAGYSLQDHGFYYLAQQIDTLGGNTVLLYVCIMVVIATLLKNASTYFALYFIAVIRNGVIRDYRNIMYNQIVELPLSYYSDERKGNLMSKMTNDLKEIEWSILRSLEATFRDPINIISFFVVLIWMSPELTLFLAVFFPVAGLLIGVVGKSLRKSAKKGQGKLGELISHLEETLSGLRIIKGFNAKDKMKDRFSEHNENYNKIMIRMYRKGDMASPMSEFLGIMLIASVLWYGGRLALAGDIDGSFFIAYIAFLSQLISPFKSITTAYSNAQKGLAAIERVKEVTEAEITIKDAPNAINIDSFGDKVEYKNVSFKYEKEYVLKNIDFSLEKGKTIALVGQSGSGKSTLADLLPRFYDIQEGEILIDGHNIKYITLFSLREQLGIVTQQSILFNDTVYNNISFGSEERATKELVIEAAKIANAHEFIEQMENGYDTNIGDSGGKLSGGQRQRLSIARAILKNPPILILDEATSALDTESEKLVQEALNNLMQNRTSLVIAHRLSTIQHADEIIVMQDGEIVERGNHNELIAQNGGYKKLIDMQSFQ